jgi:hypothetical protein
MMMPEIEKKEQGLEIQLSSKWLKAYLKRAGELRPQLVNNAVIKAEYQSNSLLIILISFSRISGSN